MVRAGRAVDKAIINYSEDVNSDQSSDEGGSKKATKKQPKQKKSAAPARRDPSEDSSDDDEPDDGELNGDDSDYELEDEEPPKKKAKKTPVKKKTPAKKLTPKATSRASGSKKPVSAKSINTKKVIAKKSSVSTSSAGQGRAKKPVQYTEDSDDDSDGDDDDQSEQSDDSYRGRKVPNFKKFSKKQHPPISEMVPKAIKNLNANPRKGSSLAAIKAYMAETWSVNTKKLAPQIKAYVINAAEDGEIIRKSGSGASGRFTIKGLKPKRKKKKKKAVVSDEEDGKEDEGEYKPVKRARDEEREREEKEKEERHQKRKEEEIRKEMEKANRPKQKVERRTDYEVEFIKAMKVVDDKTWYQVKFDGWKKPSWEPEENLTTCQDMIENFILEEKVRRAEVEERRRREEEEGNYEVGKILEVKFPKGRPREFLIRWKGHGEDMDSWEPDDNLECRNLIDKFMMRHMQRMEASEKSLRLAPKRVERMNFAASARQSKRNNGFRMTYEDMDE